MRSMIECEALHRSMMALGVVRQFLASQIHVGNGAWQIRVIVDGDSRVEKRG